MMAMAITRVFKTNLPLLAASAILAPIAAKAKGQG